MLGACTGGGATRGDFTAAASAGLTVNEIPLVPSRYAKCAKLASLPSPKGGWNLEKAKRAIATLRASEIEKHDCLLDLDAWATETLNGIRGGRGR